jgi:hypothetical protein
MVDRAGQVWEGSEASRDRTLFLFIKPTGFKNKMYTEWLALNLVAGVFVSLAMWKDSPLESRSWWTRIR